MLAGQLGLLLSLLVWGPLNPARRRRNSLGGYENAAPRVVEERRLYRDQTPRVIEERRVYQDQPPL